MEEAVEEMMKSQDEEADDDEEMNYEEKLEAFKKAAHEGDTDAMMALAEIFSEAYWSYGMNESDIPFAIEWYKKAAERGVTDAMMALGEIADNGSKQTSPEAVDWYEKLLRRATIVLQVP